jgi:hypothetical protein
LEMRLKPGDADKEETQPGDDKSDGFDGGWHAE